MPSSSGTHANAPCTVTSPMEIPEYEDILHAAQSETGSLPNLPPSPISIAQSSASSVISGQAVVDLNRYFAPIGISHAKPSDMSKPGVIKSKLERSFQAYEKKNQKGGHIETPVVSWMKKCDDCEDLLHNMKIRYAELEDKRNKYQMLTCAPKSLSCNGLHTAVGCSWYEAKISQELRLTKGVLYYPDWKSPGHGLDERIKKDVVQFYLNTDNARISADAKEAVLLYNEQGDRTSEYVQKRRLLYNLKDLYSMFSETHGQLLSISKFAELRPHFCIWPGNSGMHSVCTCILHENFKFLLEAINQPRDVGAVIRGFLCNSATRNCYLGYCDSCPKYSLIDEFDRLFDVNEVTYRKWDCQERSNIKRITESIDDFKDTFKSFVGKIKPDYLILQTQL
ncbi:unnamed protein product [Allacma fusca]|uniref:Uncharacterized protein n=1 Tax=Allacma fusca TaxID=39272 RepID=A0A8J2LEL8_9HEXA|nr:unnamed protein product [Allacma fusca]